MSPEDRIFRRILVVDDDQDTADSVGLLLKLTGNDVRIAYSAIEALAVVPYFKPDVCIVDVVMPFMDGIELTRRLRAMRDALNAVIIAYTGMDGMRCKEHAQKAGVDYFVLKPTIDPLTEHRSSNAALAG